MIRDTLVMLDSGINAQMHRVIDTCTNRSQDTDHL